MLCAAVLGSILFDDQFFFVFESDFAELEKQINLGGMMMWASLTPMAWSALTDFKVD